jgi:hypothetical protein
MSRKRTHDPAEITEVNRPFVIEWLRDRSAFHTWFSSVITGSLVLVTVFGNKPGFTAPGGVFLVICLVLLVLSLLANLVCVWSIPSWKYRVSVGIVTNAAAMRRELAITAWIGVISFVSALTFAFIGNSPS